MNGLVSIFVDALSDNLTKVLRESSGFKKITYNIAHFVHGIVTKTDIAKCRDLCPVNDENDLTLLYRRSTGGDAGVCRESTVRALVPPEADPAGHCQSTFDLNCLENNK